MTRTEGMHAIGLIHELDILQDIRRFFLENAEDLDRQQADYRTRRPH
jgi:hypothetical protein